MIVGMYQVSDFLQYVCITFSHYIYIQNLTIDHILEFMMRIEFLLLNMLCFSVTSMYVHFIFKFHMIQPDALTIMLYVMMFYNSKYENNIIKEPCSV